MTVKIRVKDILTTEEFFPSSKRDGRDIRGKRIRVTLSEETKERQVTSVNLNV